MHGTATPVSCHSVFKPHHSLPRRHHSQPCPPFTCCFVLFTYYSTACFVCQWRWTEACSTHWQSHPRVKETNMGESKVTSAVPHASPATHLFPGPVLCSPYPKWLCCLSVMMKRDCKHNLLMSFTRHAGRERELMNLLLCSLLPPLAGTSASPPSNPLRTLPFPSTLCISCLPLSALTVNRSCEHTLVMPFTSRQATIGRGHEQMGLFITESAVSAQD